MKNYQQYLKTLLESEKSQSFYHYGNHDKGIAGTWGSDNIDLYKHFGGSPKIFTFNDSENILVVNARGFDSVPSESIFNSLNPNNYAIDQEIFEDFEEVELFMDLVVAISSKEKGYDGVIFKTNNGLQSLDLRNITLSQLKNNYELAKQGKLSYY